MPAAKVLDASAVLAVLYAETGAAKVKSALSGALMSAVNQCEVLSVLVRNGLTIQEAERALRRLRIAVLDFTPAHARAAAGLLACPEARALSAGDRACLATAMLAKATALTADRLWLTVSVDVPVECIR